MGEHSLYTLFSKPFTYFEVKILDAGAGVNSFLSVGLSASPMNEFQQVGWSRFSAGYHSDDGKLYCETYQNGQALGPKYSKGDIVGCGHDSETGRCFFTLNGDYLGSSQQQFFSKMVPAVAAIRAWHVKINLGDEPFAFLLANSYNFNRKM